MDPGYAIDVAGLRKSFGEVEVLSGVDLRVERGTMLALLGPNGAGKTTTVRILSTLLDADGGMALVNGYDVGTEAAAVRRTIGLTGQQTAVDGLLTGYENLVMMGRLFRMDAADAKRRARDLLDRFDLADAADRRARTYSGGMRRRLDLAISLLTAPPVLFLDEPTTGLDPRSRTDMWALLRDLLAGGMTILLTTQYLEEADQLADQVAVVDDGHVVAEGKPAELKRRVGAERLVLTFADAGSVEAARRALASESLRVDEAERTISVAIDHAKDVKRLLDVLASNSADPEHLTVDAPTLDDVFLSLTGAQAGGVAA